MDDVGVRISGPISSSDDVQLHGVGIPVDEIELAGKLGRLGTSIF
jgi:hypothetical protein